ncbi:MAG: hypothetical protein HYR96_02780 [Deltaproteobacteria bacterium]|nr:hypothetical protein [Deltaproteobacteria bacterium]MBI3294026.1 hypothetical protein [Deltaproteobacteria bacterium]
MKLPHPEIPVLKSYPKGNDVAAVYPDGILTLTYWDLWCLLTAKQRFGAELSSLRKALIDKRRNERFFGESQKETVEDLIALLYDLQERVREIASVDEILAGIPEKLVKKESQKAIRNIIEAEGYYPPSEPMLRSPRRVLFAEAMRGMWPSLPVEPTPIARLLHPLFTPKKDPGYFPKGATFALSRRVEKAVAKELSKADELTVINRRGYRYAVYRAVLTLFHEEHHWDDSYGTMGNLGQTWVKEILVSTADDIGVESKVFLKDLLMFFCWENYGLSDSKQLIEFLQRLEKTDLSLAVAILTDIKDRAEQGFQEYFAENAGKFLEKFSTSRPVSGLRLVPSPSASDSWNGV